MVQPEKSPRLRRPMTAIQIFLLSDGPWPKPRIRSIGQFILEFIRNDELGRGYNPPLLGDSMRIGVGLPLPPDCKVHAVVAETFMILAGLEGFEFRPYYADGIYVACNRNNVANRFLKDKWADILWFLDSDNGIDADGFKLMIEDIKRNDIDILTAVYVQTGGKKFIDTVPMGFNLSHHGYPYFFDPIDRASFLPPGKLAKMTDREESRFFIAPAGCLMVKRKVFEKVPFPWFQNYLDYQPEKGICHNIGEDNYFSIYVQKHGFDIWLEPRVNSPHCKGPIKYTLQGEQDFIQGG